MDWTGRLPKNQLASEPISWQQVLVFLGKLLVGELTGKLGTQVIRGDPIRIIAAFITGVSFLGAGTIIRQRSDSDIKGLTTAASLLFASRGWHLGRPLRVDCRRGSNTACTVHFSFITNSGSGTETKSLMKSNNKLS